MQNDLRIKRHPVLEINRGKRISFRFNGQPIEAYEGESVAAALYACGVRIFSRSFKYHRPRGLFCLHGNCSHCLMRVDGVPNVRTCMEKVRDGVQVESQNAWPSLKFDVAALTGSLDFLVRPGFQYRRFIRPRWAYHLWERFLRRMAGIGSLADIKNPAPAKRRQADPEIVVVGGGTAGLSAALHAARTGAQVWLVERDDTLGGRGLYDTTKIEEPERQTSAPRFEYARKLAKEVATLTNCHVLRGAAAFAWYDEGILAVSRPAELWELKPQKVIVATGSYENPLLFANNDLPGIFLSDAVMRLMHRYFIRPGRKAMVVTQNDRGYAIARQLMAAGVEVTGIIDDRAEEKVLSGNAANTLKQSAIPIHCGFAIAAASGRRHVNGIVCRPAHASPNVKSKADLKLRGDVLCIVGTRTPANELIFQKTCAGTYILESPNQFSRQPITDAHLRVDTEMFVAGEAAGHRGLACTWLAGKVAGLSAALDLGHGNQKTGATRDEAVGSLQNLAGLHS